MPKDVADDATDDAVEPESEAVELTSSSAEEPTAEETAEEPAEETAEPAEAGPARPGPSLRVAATIGLVVVVVLAGLTGWLGYQARKSHQAEQQRELFLQVGRQAAVNLTSIDWQQVDADVQRVLDSATGTFYDNFSNRAQPFTEVVKQAKSKSVGTVTEAGVESETDNGAKVLVAVTVNTANAGAPQQWPRYWRMLLTVQKIDDQAKVSNVEFVQ